MDGTNIRNWMIIEDFHPYKEMNVKIIQNWINLSWCWRIIQEWIITDGLHSSIFETGLHLCGYTVAPLIKIVA